MPLIKKINSHNFRKYGWVIEYPDKNSQSKKKNLFRIVLRESGKLGWRIAYLVVRDKAVSKLEQHPESFESFEPVKGKSLLYLAASKELHKIELFSLDQPVILKKGVWHAIITKGKESEVKITENSQVKCVYWLLGDNLEKIRLAPGTRPH